MKPRAGTIYSRDRSISKSHVSSASSKQDFPICKYQMPVTMRSALSTTPKTTSTQKSHPPKKSVHFQQPSTPCSESYSDLMSSIRINSNIDSLEQLNKQDTFNHNHNHGNDNHNENHFTCKSDSLQRFQEEPLKEIKNFTNIPVTLENTNKTLMQMTSLQKIFRELKQLKGWRELQGDVERIEDLFLQMERNILKASSEQKSNHKVSTTTTWCTSSAKTDL